MNLDYFIITALGFLTIGAGIIALLTWFGLLVSILEDLLK